MVYTDNTQDKHKKLKQLTLTNPGLVVSSGQETDQAYSNKKPQLSNGNNNQRDTINAQRDKQQTDRSFSI